MSMWALTKYKLDGAYLPNIKPPGCKSKQLAIMKGKLKPDFAPGGLEIEQFSDQFVQRCMNFPRPRAADLLTLLISLQSNGDTLWPDKGNAISVGLPRSLVDLCFPCLVEKCKYYKNHFLFFLPFISA